MERTVTTNGDASDEVYQPPTKNIHLPNGLEDYKKMYSESINNPDQFWDKMAKAQLTWHRPYDQVRFGDLNNGNIGWFLGGELNASYNCIDRHLSTKGDKAAILWEGDEPSQQRKITYNELYSEVNRLANALKELGVKKGDVVCIYMPMVPEAAYAMLATTRLGAIHSVVFAGFSAESVRDRINDNKAKVVITADFAIRGGKTVPLKQTVDEALLGCSSVEKVLIHKHTNLKIPMHPTRDIILSEIMKKQRPYCSPVWVNSEDPLFVLYTSGSTGRPKGLVHSTGGYLLGASTTHKYVFDYREGDLHGCVADIGWITGHTYIVYGPLLNGATTFMFEGTPLHPNPSRYWDMVERYKFNTLYTAPTAIRTLMKYGEEAVKKHDRSSLRVLGSVGEPINPEAWRWYFNVVGDKKCSIVDTFWQTETGSIICSPIAGVTPMKPGSATLPFFGIDLAVFNSEGQKLDNKDVEGVLALSKTWPSMARTVLGDHERYMETYLKPYPGHYFTGDGCKIDKDGFLFITGRVDDVIHKSGHRLGTAEIESALLLHPACAEAAVIGVPDEVKGNNIFAYVTLKEGYAHKESLNTIVELKQEVRKHIGSLATPDTIVLTPGLPKTRSGKIMRRLLRKIAQNETSAEQLGDISTLADPEIVKVLIQKVKDQVSQQHAKY